MLSATVTTVKLPALDDDYNRKTVLTTVLPFCLDPRAGGFVSGSQDSDPGLTPYFAPEEPPS